MRRSGLLVTLALLVMALCTFAQEWDLNLSVYRNPDTVKTITIMTSVYGSDLYDPVVIIGSDTTQVDVGAPPPPPSGFYTYFPLSDTSTPLTALLVDARSSTQDTIIWTVFWGGTSYPDSVTVEWNPASLPSHGTMLAASPTVGMDADWATATDMSTASTIKTSGIMNWVKIRFVVDHELPDITPPYFSGWIPADGAIDVPETTTMFCVDILDDQSPIDETTIAVTVFGMSIPSMFITTTPITGGVQACVNSGGMITLPSCSTITWIVSADDTAGNTGTDTASFVTAGCGGLTFCVDGTVTLEGATDYTGSVVLVGGYHDSTDATGAYEVCGVPAGTLMVFVYHDGYEVDSLELILDADTTLDFALDLLTGSISGTVTLDGMSDYSGVVVTDWVNDIDDTTNALGEYTLEDVPLGSVEIYAVYTGYAPGTDLFTLNGDTTGVDFYLFAVSDSYTVEGTVTLEGATDYTGTEIIMSGVAFAETVTTAATGAFSFDVEEGSYDFLAIHADYEAFDTTFMVDGDLVLALELDTLETPVTAYNPPSNLQASNRPCYPNFIIVSWNEPMSGDTTMLSHSAGPFSCGYWDPYVWYSPFGAIGGGYAVPFVAPMRGALLTKFSLDIATLVAGTQTEFHVWAVDDSGGPGADLITPILVTFSSTVDFETYEVEIDPPLAVDDDIFFIGWIDKADYPNCIFARQDYTTPDTLTWLRYTDSTWAWYGDRVNSADIDFSINAFVADTSGSRSRPIEGMTMAERLQSTKVSRHPDLEDLMRNLPYTEDLKAPEGEGTTPRPRPMEVATGYRLYRHTATFTDTATATLIATMDDTIYSYIDTAITPGSNYYYGIVADYADGSSDLSDVMLGYTNTGPEADEILIIDWAGGRIIEEDLGWEWDPTDSLVNLLADIGIGGDSITVTGEHERLYVTELVDLAGAPMFELVIIEWNPLSASGWLGPRPRDAECNILWDYLTSGGNLFIEGADAMEILSGDGYTENPYDTLYEILGVNFYDPGISSLDTGNVMTLTGTAPLFSPTFTEDYSLAHISDFGIDEFEHSGSGSYDVLNSQLTTPLPHMSNGRGVWRENAAYGCTTYCQSPYLASIIDIPSGTTAEILQDIMIGFGFVMPGIEEQPVELPGFLTLRGNIPNPFNAATAIVFELEEPAEIELNIYDLLGNKVTTLADKYLKPGNYSMIWDGRDVEGYSVESGIYFYKLSTSAGSVTKRMILLK